MSFDFEKRELLKPIKMPVDSVSMTASPDNTAISTLFDKFSVNLQTANDDLSGAIFTGFRVTVKTVPGRKFIINKKRKLLCNARLIQTTKTRWLAA